MAGVLPPTRQAGWQSPSDRGSRPGSAPAVVAELLVANFPASTSLSAEGASALVARCGALGIGGGSIYDALVGAAAAEQGLVLVTRDRRASGVHRALDVEVELLEGGVEGQLLEGLVPG